MNAAACGRVVTAAALVGVGLATAGCKTREVQDQSWLDAGAASGASAANATPAAAADASSDAPRCRATGARVAIPGGALVASDGVLDGASNANANANANGSGILFGLSRPNGAAAWAHLDRPGGQLSVHDLPGGDPDAPPPELAVRRGSPDQVFLLYSQSDASRADGGHPHDAGAPALGLVIEALHGDAAEPVSRIPEPRDDSLDADLAFGPASSPGSPGASAGLVVWDDDDPFGRFGRIRAARLDGAGHVLGEPLLLTPDGTDAESPQVIATRTSFVVVYRVRRGEVQDAGLVEDAVEAPGERRAFHWLEAVVVPAVPPAPSAPPAPAVSPRALTSPTGHVGAFVVPAEPDADDSFDLVARDDDAPRDAAGAKILAIHLGGDFATSPTAAIAPRILVPAGVGSGAISLVSARSPGAAGAGFVVFAGDDDLARVVSLDPARGPARIEPALDGVDPVSLVGAPPTLITFSLDPASIASAPGRRQRATSLASVVCP